MTDEHPDLIEGEDFYLENGNWVFTAKYLLRRGYCCRSGCRHCPYGFVGEESKRPFSEIPTLSLPKGRDPHSND